MSSECQLTNPPQNDQQGGDDQQRRPHLLQQDDQRDEAAEDERHPHVGLEDDQGHGDEDDGHYFQERPAVDGLDLGQELGQVDGQGHLDELGELEADPPEAEPALGAGDGPADGDLQRQDDQQRQVGGERLAEDEVDLQ